MDCHHDAVIYFVVNCRIKWDSWRYVLDVQERRKVAIVVRPSPELARDSFSESIVLGMAEKTPNFL